MVNYKIGKEHTISVTNNYVERGGDILEIKTDQIIKRNLGFNKAKELVRHLNFGVVVKAIEILNGVHMFFPS